MTVLRYVERNPARAELARLAERWDWSSARFWKEGTDRPSFLVPRAVKRPRDWLGWVDQAVTPGEVEAIRRIVNRGSPYGGPTWTARTASALGLESTIRPRGRPKTKADAEGPE